MNSAPHYNQRLYNKAKMDSCISILTNSLTCKEALLRTNYKKGEDGCASLSYKAVSFCYISCFQSRVALCWFEKEVLNNIIPSFVDMCSCVYP